MLALKKYHIGILIMTLLLSACLHEKSNSESYFNQVQGIEREIVDLTSEFDLVRIEKFVNIWKNPSKYRESSLALLQDKNATEIEKKIAILSMQKLSLDEYVDYCLKILVFRKEGLVSQYVLACALFPAYEWNTQLYENYRYPPVEALYNKIIDDKMLPLESKREYDIKYVKRILSGAIKSEIADLRSANQIIDISKYVYKRENP